MIRDSISLSASERRALLERLALHELASPAQAGTDQKRIQPPPNISVETILTHPGGGEVHVRAVVRDVSKTGMGMLYGGYLHHGTRVIVRFVGDDCTALIVQGAKVVRCNHVQGLVHDVGMKFDTELPVESLFGLADDPAGDDDSPQAASYAQLDTLCNDLHQLIRSRNSFAEIAELAKRLGEAAEKESAVGEENPPENEKPADTPG